ncbi:MCE family protein [Nocardia niigatensis]|uniref:MCE family protein n=1 Tax=Nocardia niigatensis TaxID=209249 RepID=UPI000307FAC9|nr:MCE family protein [Nocardia niigatensis]
MKTSTTVRAGSVLLLAALLTAGCRFDGANSIPLPGNVIHHGSYTVRVELRDTQNLVANSFVKADNVTVGTITSIAVRNNIAVATLEIDKGVWLPATVTARLAQTSVLGAQYLELTTPKDNVGDRQLRDGDVIPLSASSEYPATEEVLAALSLVLNGSGLQQIRTIMSELNQGLSGHEDAVNRSFSRLATFVSGLDAQRDDIVRAIDSLDAFAKELADQKDTLRTGIEQIQPALSILNEQKTQLVTMLDRVGAFGQRAAQVLRSSHDDLTSDLHNLQPVLGQLAAAGSDLTGSLLVAATFPFPVTVADKAIKGDYVNLFLTLDLSVEAIRDKIIGSIPFKDLVPMSNRVVNPLLAPTQTDAAGRQPAGVDADRIGGR